MILEIKVGLVFLGSGVVFTTFLYGIYWFAKKLQEIKSKRDQEFIDNLNKREDRNISDERQQPTNESFDSRKHRSVQTRR